MSSHAMNTSPWVKLDAAGPSSSSSPRRVGLGLGSTDLSNSMSAPHPRQGGAVLGVFPTPSSFGERENRQQHPRSPPRIRVSASSPSHHHTAAAAAAQSGYSSDESSADLSPSLLRVKAFPQSFSAGASSTSSSSRRAPSSRPSFLASLVPKRFRPRSIPDSPPLEVPRSPSLLRPHPSTRHGPSSRRACTPRRALVVLMLAALVVALHATGVEHVERWRARGSAALGGERAAVAFAAQGEAQAPPRGAGAGAQERPREAVRAPEMEKRPRPHRAAKVDKQDGQRAGPAHPPAAVAAPAQDALLPFVAEPAGNEAASGPRGGVVDAAERVEDEQAGLEAVVQQAEKEAARAEVELNEQLEMEKVSIKHKKKPRPMQVHPKGDKVVEAIVAVPAEVEAKAQLAVDKAVAAAKKKAANQKKKDASRYKRLLPTGVPPRRHLYGANFVLSADDLEAQTEVEDPELTNAMVKVPTAKQLAKLFAQGKKHYAEDEDDWRSFVWQAPPADASLQRFVDKLDPVRLLSLLPRPSLVVERSLTRLTSSLAGGAHPARLGPAPAQAPGRSRRRPRCRRAARARTARRRADVRPRQPRQVGGARRRVAGGPCGQVPGVQLAREVRGDACRGASLLAARRRYRRRSAAELTLRPRPLPADARGQAGS